MTDRHPLDHRTAFERARPRLTAVSLGALLLLGGCAAQMEHRNGMGLLADGKAVEGVERLRRASAMEPDNVGYRMDFLNRRETILNEVLAKAEALRADGQPDAALAAYREALSLDNVNLRARTGLRAVEADRKADADVQTIERSLEAKQWAVAQDQVQRALKGNPQHPRLQDLKLDIDRRVEAERQGREERLAARAAFKRPVTLQFRDTPLKMVFEALAKVGNINIVVDREVKSDLRSTIFVKDASIEDALDVILLQNQLERRLLSSNTLLIYPATAAKVKELAELKVRTFQLSNVDVNFMASIIKTMVKTRDVVTDVKSNSLVMRDTPEAIALAERLIAANDLPDPEVMLEVEVLEVSSSRTSELGLKLPTALTLSVPTPATGGLTVGALRSMTRNDLLVSPLSATLNMMLQDGDATVLASPRIRSRNKEKARILVGDKLPIITNLISQQQAGQNSVVTGSIQYVEVGIKLEVESQVYGDGDVGIKLNLEVSNVTDTIQTESGRAYQIGTRGAQTALRLHDGETQVMAGLISDSDRTSALKVPGIGQMPLLGRLFSNNTDNVRKTEIVLSITPHIIRPQAIPNARDSDAWSGTDGSIRDSSLSLEPVAVVKAATPGGAAAASPAATTVNVAPAVVVQVPAAAPAKPADPAAQPAAVVPAAAATAAQPAAAAAPAAAPAAAATTATPPGARVSPTVPLQTRPGPNVPAGAGTLPGLPLITPRPLPMRPTTLPEPAAGATTKP